MQSTLNSTFAFLKILPWRPEFRAMLIACLCGLISGCAGMMESYIEPSTEPKASIRFVASTEIFGNVFVSQVPKEGTCGSDAMRFPLNNVRRIAVLHGLSSNHKRLGLPVAAKIQDERDFVEILIPAHQKFAFDMYQVHIGVTEIATCNVTLEFSPSPGRIYEAIYSPQAKQAACVVRLYEIVRADDGTYIQRKEESARKREPNCVWWTK